MNKMPKVSGQSGKEREGEGGSKRDEYTLKQKPWWTID